MISGILGKKVGMIQIFKEGKCLPVTVIEVGPCTVMQVKTKEKDGYTALQLGFEDKKVKDMSKGPRRIRRATKPEIGHAKKHANTLPKRFVREIEWDGKEEVVAGQQITVDILENFTAVDVIGTSKGRGFQGGVKRYHFKGGPKTHGQSDRLRAPGSIGSSAYPSRVFKGMRMAGHMGNERCTLQNIKLVDIDKERNWISIMGSVPGPNGGYVIVRKSKHTK